MSGSVWYLSLSEDNIKFERYNKYEKIKEIPIKKNKKQLQKIKKNNTKKTILAFFSFLISIFFFNFVYSEPINDTFHINLQTTFPNGTIQTGTFNFAFNITENPNLTSCEQPVVYNHSVTLTTDLRGIVSLYLPQIGSGGGNLSALSFDKQYYLCYYRDGVLRNITQLGRVPYAFRATQVNLSDVAIDTNLSLGNFNVSANYGFFSFLGSLASKITKIFAIDADISNNLDIGKNLTVSGNLSAGGVLFVNNDTGKVGIGTVTPSEALDVVGTIQSTGPFQTTSNEIIYAGSPLGQVKFFRPPTTNDIALYAGGLERVRIDSSGNVGINTSTPQATLNVLGTLNVTGASIFQASICNPGEVLTTTSTGQLVCVADQNSGGTITGQGTFGYIPLWNSSSSLNNSIIYQNGTRIGIGTTTPGEEFEVNGDILASGPFQTTSNEIIYAGSPLGQVKFFRPPTTNDIALYAGGLERVRIDSSGNVGIATTTPQQKLHVNGSAVFNGTINMDNNKIINLANGTSAQDAVTLSQLQSVNSTATNAVPQSRTLEI
ncbi:MAG: hypothetical protein KatS3mg001_106 [Candidatus Pacearchaeota archaeon]|nr:MAG: hypothetical protein KatS3mg001_106 [Candidatus Pacearchaeota archaeon]